MDGFQRVINDLAQRDNRVDGDYVGDDGLLYCGKCHTRKQFRHTLDGVERIFPIICKCENDRRIAERQAFEAQEARMYIDSLRRDGMTDAAYLSRTFDRDDKSNQAVSRLCHRYVDHWQEMREAGQGLLFYGGVGTGKSFYACCIANALIDRGIPALVTSFPRILEKLQAGFGENRNDVIRRLQRYNLLVLDDLGVERSTPYAMEQLYQVVDARLLSRKPLIVTTNLTPDDLNHPSGVEYSRIYDRLKEMCLPVKVDGKSRRNEIAAERRRKCMEILQTSVGSQRESGYDL